MAKNLFAHEQREMPARRHSLFNGTSPRIDQMLGCKYLLGGDDFVVLRGEQEQRTTNRGEIDFAAERHEPARGKAVFFE